MSFVDTRTIEFNGTLREEEQAQRAFWLNLRSKPPVQNNGTALLRNVGAINHQTIARIPKTGARALEARKDGEVQNLSAFRKVMMRAEEAEPIAEAEPGMKGEDESKPSKGMSMPACNWMSVAVIAAVMVAGGYLIMKARRG